MIREGGRARAPNLETYRNPDLPLADGGIDALARFVKGR
jgi:hypothetical protein